MRPLHEIEPRPLGIGSGPAEPRERTIDQGREFGFEHIVTEAQPLHRPGPVVLDQDIGIRQQTPQHGLSVRALEVEADSALTAIHHHVGGALAS
jgi:hypothetical protein